MDIYGSVHPPEITISFHTSQITKIVLYLRIFDGMSYLQRNEIPGSVAYVFVLPTRRISEIPEYSIRDL